VPETNLSPNPDPEDSEPSEGNRDTANLVALAFVVLLVIGCIWLFRTLSHNNDVVNCVASGRRHCADIETTPR
jgi:hypothetical protein